MTDAIDDAGSDTPTTGPVSSGKFVGSVKTEWLHGYGRPDRVMVLLEDFAYVDANGLRWVAEKGTCIDGASIPSVFWTLIGPPFVGQYRRASVVHDAFCKTQRRSWQDTHRMFWEACLAGGVPSPKAKVMGYGVYRFGPRWDASVPSPTAVQPTLLPAFDALPKAGDAMVEEASPDANELSRRIREMQEVESWIAAEDPSMEDVWSRASAPAPTDPGDPEP